MLLNRITHFLHSLTPLAQKHNPTSFWSKEIQKEREKKRTVIMVVVFFLLRTSPAVKLRVGHRVYSLSSVVGLFVSVLFDSILSVSLSASIPVSCSFLSLFSYSYSISTSLFVAFNCCFQHSHTTGKQTIISLITISLLLSLFLQISDFHFKTDETRPLPRT